MGPNITTDIVTYDEIAEASDTALRSGLAFGPYLAGYLNSIMIRDTPEYNDTQYLANRSMIVRDNTFNADNTQLIRCSDAMLRAVELADIEHRVQNLTELGDWNSDYIMSSYMLCSQWKIQAKERYERKRGIPYCSSARHMTVALQSLGRLQRTKLLKEVLYYNTTVLE